MLRGFMENTEVTIAVIQPSPKHRCSFTAAPPSILTARRGCLRLLFSLTRCALSGWRGKRWDGSLGCWPWGNSPAWAVSWLSRLCSHTAGLETAQISAQTSSLLRRMWDTSQGLEPVPGCWFASVLQCSEPCSGGSCNVWGIL